MAKRYLPLVLLCLTVAATTYAACPASVPARYENGNVIFTLAPVSRPVFTLESTEWDGDFPQVVSDYGHDTRKPSEWLLGRQSTADHDFHYTITWQQQAGNVFETCTANARVTVTADPVLRKLLRRSILPIVGSVRGANGSNFKTELRLRGVASTRGRMVFRPVGTLPSDSDPSMPYAFETGSETLVWDDVVAAMGTSGLGTLEFIPDEGSEDYAPRGEARLYNDTGDGGTFGTRASTILPIDFLGGPASGAILPLRAGSRGMIGLRTLEKVRLFVDIIPANGRSFNAGIRDLPADFTIFTTPEGLAGRTLAPGDTVSLRAQNGAAIAFYSLTDNKTNDPELVIAEKPRSSYVGRYIFPRTSDFMVQLGFH